MWQQSGVYLDICGDRDMMCRSEWLDRFYTLQQDPYSLYLKLRNSLLRYSGAKCS